MNATSSTLTTDSIPQQPEPSSISRAQRWTGRILTGVAGLFCLFDGAMKLVQPAPVVKATVELGYPESAIVGIGVVLLVSTILYLIPRTAFVGAILLTGYLGGAVASQVRISAPLFSVVFPVLFGCIVWAGLYLRDTRLRTMLEF